jgi:membrane protease YdiL (CAAX protease family)
VTGPAAEDVPRAALAREAWLASAGILLALGAIKHAGHFVPLLAAYGGTLALGLQLYLPLLLRGRRGVSNESLGLTLARWRTDLKVWAVWAAVVTVPFALGHHLWQTALMGRPFVPGLPEGLLQHFFMQTLIVALAEEVFFRGYLQERLQRLWPARRTLFGAPFGLAIVVTSVVFALAHFVGEYNPARLGPFFPGLLFGWLRARTRTVVGAAAFHAYANLLGDLLWGSYR